MSSPHASAGPRPSRGLSHAPPANAPPTGTTAWILTDGKAGDEQPCLAVAEALGLSPSIRRIAPRALFRALNVPAQFGGPWGPLDPRLAPGRPDSPVGPPFPDILVASGGRVAPYVRALKRASGGRTFTLILKDPRTGPRSADFIWTPSHDRLRGENVLATLTSPHRLSAERLASSAANPPPPLASLPELRIAVLVGGHSRHLRFTDDDGDRLVGQLSAISDSGASLMITLSRRTPPAVAAKLRRLADERDAYFFDGSGENPYPAMMALAGAIVVTADSVNMVSDAVATGVPVHVFELPGGGARHGAFLRELERLGATRPLSVPLASWAYEKLDSTPLIAQVVANRYAAFRASLARLPGA